MTVEGKDRRVLLLACAAILLTAADTYVVVLALPEMMTSVGLTSAELPRAAPIISLFLLGYIAVLPVLGRLSDHVGRHPVLLGCVAVFCVGSAVTAGAGDLGGVVFGRFLQGLGGGGLVPVTLALVADRWPADRRGVPLGAVGAVQELGSVVGPLYGAALIAAGGWRLIFWLNVIVGAVVGVGLRSQRADTSATEDLGSRSAGIAHDGADGPRRRRSRPQDAPRTPRWLGGLGAAGVFVALIAAAPPAPLARSVAVGWLAEPLVSDLPLASLTSPLWVAAVSALLIWAAVLLRHRSATGGTGGTPARLWRELDGLGGLLLAAALGAVVLALASPDPETQTLNDGGGPLLIAAALIGVAFVVRQRSAAHPLVPLDALRAPAAWGALLVSLLVGAGLIAALVDIPLFARATVPSSSQLDAALVLLRFLVGLPVGAVLGGLALRRLSPAVVAAAGCGMAAAALFAIAAWDADVLSRSPGSSDVQLLIAGFGVGLAVAPVNDAALAAVRAELHGLVSALIVVARNAGMLLGLSGLTALGLSRFRTATAEIPSPSTLCPDSPLDCPPHADALQDALLAQLSTIFTGAGWCLAAAALASLVLLRSHTTRAADGEVQPVT